MRDGVCSCAFSRQRVCESRVYGDVVTSHNQPPDREVRAGGKKYRASYTLWPPHLTHAGSLLLRGPAHALEWTASCVLCWWLCVLSELCCAVRAVLCVVAVRAVFGGRAFLCCTCVCVCAVRRAYQIPYRRRELLKRFCQ